MGLTNKERYDKYFGTKLAKERRASRGRARYWMEKKYGKDALKGKEIDHINTSPGKDLNNDTSNLRIVDRHANRVRGGNWRKNKKRNF